MKTSYRFIQFEEVPKQQVRRWYCKNKKAGNILAQVLFYPPWKQWIVQFDAACVFNNTCLNDISHFLKQLNDQ